MGVSRRITALFFLSAFLISSGVSFFMQSTFRSAGQHIPHAIGTIVVLLFIVIAGKLLHYQQALNRAKQNLDEAQRLAGIGSWERDLVTGKGYWSDNYYRLFNENPRAVAPTMEDFFLMVHADDRQHVRDVIDEAIRTMCCYETKYRLDADAGNRTFLSRGRVILSDSGVPVTIVGSIQDITHKQRRELFRDGLLKQKDLFISRLGHDLKTPLTPLVALLPLIRSRTEDQRQLELLDICINSVNNMNDLVIKTLRLARITSAANVASRNLNICLSAVVDAAVSNLTEMLKHHSVTIENRTFPELLVKGNQAELEEVLTQLLSNAVKFSPVDSRVSVEASCINRVVTVIVRDNGIGLSPEEQQHIFEEFYTADPSRHVLDSSGLGLTICRRIVENHGGQISAASPGKNGGTAVSFTLEAGGSI
jgi:nitrogen fixation/metabolism regulation signal transduction histidine kinase